ncbi:ribonuclease R [Desulfobaculum xiamenense]|uniref:Ribonuclease R n=1 Tax=Desulfobaculum xiamenense TaxID=995050 RepID=A0A846QVF9_9BACT|nr:ribonuclease R [Desulfobaculum xiamenense]NJB69104.1 ribonuclease R [Desulfobaculum xiamenense]
MARKGRKTEKKAGAGRVDQRSILKAFKDAGRPMRLAEVLSVLQAGKGAKRDLKDLLRDLLDQGKIIRTKGGAFGLTESMSLMTGVLEVQRSGVGFVIPEDKRRKDIFISPNDFGDAWNGDRVVCAVIPGRKGKNPEGRIVRVLDRALRKLPVRILKRLGPDMFISHPTDTKLQFNIMCDTQALDDEPQEGDIVFVLAGEKLDFKLWAGDAVEALGSEDDVAVQESLVKSLHGVPTSFPNAAVVEANALPAEPEQDDFRERVDLRDLPLVTIDGAKARDFDDAVCVRPDGQGFRLWVAIADVSHYVRPGSALDREALARGNSYYFPQSVEPMFPEALSNGLCSLNPDVNRLSMVAEMHIDRSGHVSDERFYPAVIRSHARLTYAQVHRALELKDRETRADIEDVLPMLEDAERLARILHRMRVERGTLDFDLPEPEILFNMNGETINIQRRPRTFAHQIVEEFMIAANEAVARFLERREMPCMYRIHPSPDMDKLRSVFKLLSRSDVGERIPAEASPEAVRELLNAVAGTEVEFVANRLLLRAMMQASYGPENEGHYGLASECYCHFTSPIRRYADLIVHRSLKAALGFGDVPAPKPGTLQEIGDHISGRERVAMQAEREILKRVTILFLRDKVGAEYTGVINGVADYGFWVELNEVMAEGMVRLSSLDDDYYVYLQERQEIWGERTRRRFGIGQTVRVFLRDVNLSRLEVDLELMPTRQPRKR